MQRSPNRDLLRDDAGAVAATYAMSLTALMVIAGVGFDYGRLAAMDSELQNGADQAALAGVTQLDGASGACSRAAARAVDLVTNTTIVATSANTITVSAESACDATGNVRFWQTKDHSSPATSDANARFIEVIVASRSADYAFTPIAGVLRSSIQAAAMAGLGSSVCKVPPMMICSPNAANPFDAANKIGWGVQVTGHGNGRTGSGNPVGSWAPGDFGFLSVGPGTQKEDLVKALAFKSVPLDCVPVNGTKPETGNPQALYDAINTRFDIYDFSAGNGTTLSPCFSGSCPAASNVVKDIVKADTSTNGKSCKLDSKGWHLPAADRQFWPKATANGDGTYNDAGHSLAIEAMGLPRDLCHYASFGTTCNGGASGRFGNGIWARKDYFKLNHSGGERPPSPDTVTRYQTYRWEIDQNNMPNNLAAGSDKQYGRPVCSTGTADGVDRRVFTLAVVKNCTSPVGTFPALSGSSNVAVIDEWVDMFLVEPVVDNRGNGSVNDSIYMEVIGPSKLAGAGVAANQLVRRDVPYLVN